MYTVGYNIKLECCLVNVIWLDCSYTSVGWNNERLNTDGSVIIRRRVPHDEISRRHAVIGVFCLCKLFSIRQILTRQTEADSCSEVSSTNGSFFIQNCTFENTGFFVISVSRYGLVADFDFWKQTQKRIRPSKNTARIILHHVGNPEVSQEHSYAKIYWSN